MEVEEWEPVGGYEVCRRVGRTGVHTICQPRRGRRRRDESKECVLGFGDAGMRWVVGMGQSEVV